MVQLNAKIVGANVVIPVGKFEHILNCLANLKFVGETAPCGEAMEMPEDEYRLIQKETQRAIDDCYRQGMELLSVSQPRKGGNDS